MSDCILGIKCNGVSIKIDTLKIDSDQSPYDYICNVNLSHEDNGNGQYNVTIIDKNLLQGFSIGKWKITKAWISFNWGDSYAKMIMVDSEGNETIEIIASQQAGSRSNSRGYYDTNTLARSIFTKAQKVAIEYPSAAIYNAIMDLEEKKSGYHWKYIQDEYSKVQSNLEELIDLLNYAVNKLKEYMDKYYEAKKLLEGCDDPRAKQLLTTITNDCKELLLKFKH